MTARPNKVSLKRFVDLKWQYEMVSLGLHGATKDFHEKVNMVFGHELRPWQEHATAQLRKGRDTMVKAGTGAGKSLVYQSMTQSRPNAIVLVICPLVSLMEEQVVPDERGYCTDIRLTR
jgi:superfamily II DNA helicase RecQ